MSDIDFGYAFARKVRHSQRPAPDLGHEQPDWVLAASCQFVDPEIFHPEKGGTVRPAKLICAGCPARAECLIFAFEHNERYGIYGGLSERERRKLFADGWQPGDPTPAVQLGPSRPIVVCPDCGKGSRSLRQHRAQAHGVRSVA